MKKLAPVMFLLISLNASAALYDRGNGMIYDSTQNITWLQDANYANTSGYSTANGGAMTWEQATAWANGLVYQGLSGWRLASANLLNSTNPCYANNGSCDEGYNNTSSEIGHLYAELGNLAYRNTAGVVQAGYGFTHTGPFLNVKAQDNLYWESEQYAPDTSFAWAYRTGYGYQNYFIKSPNLYAWAVRAGDVAAVPVPAAAWLFGTSLLGLLGVTRRQR